MLSIRLGLVELGIPWLLHSGKRRLKLEYTKKFLVCAAKTEASPSVTATGLSCFSAWHMWYLKSLSKCRPWVHLEFLVRGNTVFYSTLRTTNRRP